MTTESKSETIQIVQRALQYITVLFLGIISFFSIKLYETVDTTAMQVESMAVDNARFQERLFYMQKELDKQAAEIKEQAERIGGNTNRNNK